MTQFRRILAVMAGLEKTPGAAPRVELSPPPAKTRANRQETSKGEKTQKTTNQSCRPINRVSRVVPEGRGSFDVRAQMGREEKRRGRIMTLCRR
jgi:hypothetical protein